MTVRANGKTSEDIPDRYKIPAMIDGYRAVITNIFGAKGEEVDYPPKGLVAVGYFEEGPQAGGWFTSDCADWSWTYQDAEGHKSLAPKHLH